ncbi:MAG: hypothetical protein ACYCXB_10495, partial [Candidatus Humimicrobiaceae bacterium]
MKKFWLLIILFILFLAFIAFFVNPQQGGRISSTEIRQQDLQKADPIFEEKLPIQEVGPMSGKGSSQARSIFIAVVMLTHVLFANLHLGGSLVAVITASIYLRNKEKRYDLLSKSITLFNVILFSLGAT